MKYILNFIALVLIIVLFAQCVSAAMTEDYINTAFANEFYVLDYIYPDFVNRLEKDGATADEIKAFLSSIGTYMYDNYIANGEDVTEDNFGSDMEAAITNVLTYRSNRGFFDALGADSGFMADINTFNASEGQIPQELLPLKYSIKMIFFLPSSCQTQLMGTYGKIITQFPKGISGNYPQSAIDNINSALSNMKNDLASPPPPNNSDALNNFNSDITMINQAYNALLASAILQPAQSPVSFSASGAAQSPAPSAVLTPPSSPTSAAANNPVFNDISDVPWAAQAIEYLSSKGVLEGVGDGKFDPGGIVTREQFAKMLIYAFFKPDEAAQCNFSDVAQGQWYYQSVATAEKLGVVSGYQGGTFGVGKPVSRQEMSAMLYRAAAHLKIALPQAAAPVKYADDKKIAGYAADAVAKLQTAGIINGMGDGTFSPDGSATRAMAAKIVYGLLTLENK